MNEDMQYAVTVVHTLNRSTYVKISWVSLVLLLVIGQLLLFGLERLNEKLYLAFDGTD